MTDKLNALDKLIEAVEAGDMPLDGSSYKLFGEGWLHVFDAYHGSLDAALALHEALLPGKCWSVHTSSASVLDAEYEPAPLVSCGSMGRDATPARAWLLAILRAYRSMQQ